MSEDSCATCRFLGPIYWPDDHGIKEVNTFACRRNAPVVTGGMMSSTMTVWPWVRAAQWCGQHELAKAALEGKKDEPGGN